MVDVLPRKRITVRPASKAAARPGALSRRTQPGRVWVTERDRALFQALGTHRLLTADQLGRLVFSTAQPRRVRRRLRLLFDAGLLDRVGVVAQPTAGVPPYVYALTEDSAEIAGAEMGRPVRLPSFQSSSLRFLAHHVGVCEFFVTLTEGLRVTPWSIGEWLHEWELKVTGESETKRAERVHVTDPDTGEELALTVLPDAYFTLVNGSATLHFFFEYDRATHRLQRWRERALAFTGYARQGHFQRRFGGSEFRFLVVTTADFRGRSRCENVVQTIEQAVGASDMFLVSTVAEIKAERVLGDIWRQPGGAGRHRPLDGLAPRPVVVLR